METPKPQKSQVGSKRSWWKLLLFACVSMIVLLAVAGVLLYRDFTSQMQWAGRLQQGVEISANDREQGTAVIEKTLADARAAKVPTATLMSLYRDYARFLYSEDEKELGDQQISAAIALYPAQPTSGTAEADMLIHAYQDRGWDSHRRYLSDNSKPSGDKDQELSVSIAEKSFGPEHEQTIYKIPSLAVIYADLGYEDKADKLIQHAIDVSNTNPCANECAWFCYAMLSRIRGVQHKYKAAAVAYMHAIDLAKDQSSRDRIWEEFATGIRQGQPAFLETAALTRSLLSKDKFDELDQLGDKLAASGAAHCSGLWELDLMINELNGGPGKNDSQYKQIVYDLNHWLSKKPHSAHARAALAQCHIFNAWTARLNANGKPADNEKLFQERIGKAREVLKADPELLKKTPVAYVANARLATADRDESTYLKYLNECHSKCPNYFAIDNWGARFSGPNFFGKPGGTEKFINARANAIPGKKGDVEYARLVWNNQELLADLFGPSSIIKWPRTKAGFKQIFSEYPHDISPRVAFIEFSFQANDPDAVGSALDGFQSLTPPVAATQH